MEPVDKRRRTKIPVRNVPEPVNWLLNNCTMQQLEYLHNLTKSSTFPTFVKIISIFKDYNVYQVFKYSATSDQDLALFRAAKRGELAGLDAILMVSQMAKDEIDRRRRLKSSEPL